MRMGFGQWGASPSDAPSKGDRRTDYDRRVKGRRAVRFGVVLFMLAASAGGALAPPADAGMITPGGPAWWYDFKGMSLVYDGWQAGVRLPDGSLAAAGTMENNYGSSGDILVGRFNSSGREIWTKSWDGPDHHRDYAAAIATDRKGSVIVAGTCTSAANAKDIVVVKWAKSGAFLWSAVYDGPAHADDEAQDVAVDARGNVLVCGYADGEDGRGVVVKFNGATGSRAWARLVQTEAGGWSTLRALAVDGDGNAYVVGSRAGTTTLPDVFVRKYSTGGATRWTRTVDGADHLKDGGFALTLAPGPALYVAGMLETATRGQDALLLKYTPGGRLGWRRTWDGGVNGDDTFRAVATDAHGKAFVAGVSESGGAVGDRGLLAGYTAGGKRSWTRTFFNETSSSYVRYVGLVVSSGGNVWAGGTTDLGGSVSAALLTRYNAKGTQQWARAWTGPRGNGAVLNDLVAGGGGLFASGGFAAGPGDQDAWAGVFMK